MESSRLSLPSDLKATATIEGRGAVFGDPGEVTHQLGIRKAQPEIESVSSWCDLNARYV